MAKCSKCRKPVMQYTEMGMHGRVCPSCGKDSNPAKGFKSLLRHFLPSGFFKAKIQKAPATLVVN